MTPEIETIPDWARQERESDLAWIVANLDQFSVTAKRAFIEAGRCAIFVDTTIQLAPDAAHPYGYVLQVQIEEAANDDTKRMVKEYDPLREFVVVLLKPGDRVSTYRISAIPPDDSTGSTASNEKTSHASEPPDLATLMQWEADGGCEAACPHACWVEPDGICPHGNPSWLLKLGFI